MLPLMLGVTEVMEAQVEVLLLMLELEYMVMEKLVLHGKVMTVVLLWRQHQPTEAAVEVELVKLVVMVQVQMVETVETE